MLTFMCVPSGQFTYIFLKIYFIVLSNPPTKCLNSSFIFLYGFLHVILYSLSMISYAHDWLDVCPTPHHTLPTLAVSTPCTAQYSANLLYSWSCEATSNVETQD